MAIVWLWNAEEVELPASSLVQRAGSYRACLEQNLTGYYYRKGGINYKSVFALAVTAMLIRLDQMMLP